METDHLHANFDSPLVRAVLTHCVFTAQAALQRADGQRQAGERREEHLRRPPRRRSGAAPRCR
eukprot:6680431-Prymnesium_polylepis.1